MKVKTKHGKVMFETGMYKGIAMCDTPSDYLLALRERNLTFVRIFEGILRERGDLPVTSITRMEELVAAGQQSLAKKYHPECGGTEHEMSEVDEAAAAILELLEPMKK